MRTEGNCGVLNLLKPPGMSSAQAVSFVKHCLHGEKIGHAGTLDPEAAGVLPLMIGKATRIFDYLQEKEKAYITEVAFTGSTDTEDAQGRLLQSCGVPPTPEQLQAVLPELTGKLMQVPPNFSALKQNGVRLYELARKGQMPELPAREVTIFSLEGLGITERNGYLLKVCCSKGFYVRSLCRDLGERLNAPAHMRFLLRIQSGMFRIENAHTLEEVRKAADCGQLQSLLIPVDEVLSHLPMAEVPQRYHKAVRNGVPLPIEAFSELALEDRPCRLYVDGRLCCLSKRDGDQLVMQTWLGEEET